MIEKGMRERSLEVIQAIPLPVEQAGDLTWDGHLLRQVDRKAKRLLSLDPVSGETLRSENLYGDIAGITFDGRALWISDSENAAIHKLHVKNGDLLGRIPLPKTLGELGGLGFARGILWQADPPGGRLCGIDVATGSVVETVEVDAHVFGVTCHGDRLFYCEPQNGLLHIVDLNTSTTSAVYTLPGRPTGLTLQTTRPHGVTVLWYVDAKLNQICRLRLD